MSIPDYLFKIATGTPPADEYIRLAAFCAYDLTNGDVYGAIQALLRSKAWHAHQTEGLSFNEAYTRAYSEVQKHLEAEELKTF